MCPIMPAAESNDPGPTSLNLIQRLKRDEGDAWSRFVDLYGPLIYYWARRAGLQPDDAADITQEVLRSVAGHMAGFHKDHPGDTLRGWLWTITRNKIRDHFRRRKGRAEGAGGTDAHKQLQQFPGEVPPPSDDSVEVRDLVRRALNLIRGDFGEQTWQAFVQAVYHERSSTEIAAELGITPNAVRKAKARVLCRLREELGDAPLPSPGAK